MTETLFTAELCQVFAGLGSKTLTKNTQLAVLASQKALSPSYGFRVWTENPLLCRLKMKNHLEQILNIFSVKFNRNDTRHKKCRTLVHC